MPHCAPLDSDGERLPPAELQKLRALLVAAKLSPCCEERQELREEDQRLGELRRMYEPYVAALANRLLKPVGDWVPKAKAVDNWRTSA